jgi:transcriptional regulator with XRE-family HTH domain
MENIGKRIRSERLRLGLSQAKFAQIGGVAANAQGHYENGFRRPRADYLFKLAVMGVDVSFLVTGSRPNPAIEHPLPSGTNTSSMEIDTSLQPTASEFESRMIEHLYHSLDNIAKTLADIHRLKDRSDQRTPADHIREYLTSLAPSRL